MDTDRTAFHKRTYRSFAHREAIYVMYARKYAATEEHEILVLEEQKHHDEDISKRYRIMVAVANPANATELIQTTYRLCGAKDAHVELIHMVAVPDQVSLTDAEKYTQPGKEGLLEAMLYLSMHFPISTTIRYCRNKARGIVAAIRQKKAKMLVLGWHGRPSTHMFSIGSTVDPIIEQAPCNVVVVKDCGGNRTFNNILVPLGGGPNGALALEIAAILADSDEEGKITAFTVDTGKAKRKFDIEKFLDVQAERLKIGRKRFAAKTVTARSPVVAILRESRKHDLVVLGVTHRPLLYQIGQQSLPEKIACRCNKPLVMVKSDVGVRSWIKRWI